MFGEGSQKPHANDAVELADDLNRSLLNDAFESSNNSWKAEAYLKKLKESDPCFDYRIARDESTGAPTAIVWQTGTMRADFELYGCQLHLDFMMRKLNSYLWPHISIVVVDANGSPRCALEGLACTDRSEAYAFAVLALLDMSPGRKNGDILVVFADGRLDYTILDAAHMDLPNAKFFSGTSIIY